MDAVTVQVTSGGNCECCGTGRGDGKRVLWEDQLAVCKDCLWHLLLNPDSETCPYEGR